MGVAIRIPRASAQDDPQRRLKRLRAVAWFLDRSIPIGGRWRIGVDPILGLLPGIGDWIGAILSLYVVYESARLGAPAHLLARMGGNILLESVIGTVPLVGDLFDFAWQANARNLALIEAHHNSSFRPRSPQKMWFMVALICIVVLAAIGGLVYLFAKILDRLVQ
jgi:hypothetical protein